MSKTSLRLNEGISSGLLISWYCLKKACRIPTPKMRNTVPQLMNLTVSWEERTQASG